jgi:hypothetical protein
MHPNHAPGQARTVAFRPGEQKAPVPVPKPHPGSGTQKNYLQHLAKNGFFSS